MIQTYSDAKIQFLFEKHKKEADYLEDSKKIANLAHEYTIESHEESFISYISRLRS